MEGDEITKYSFKKTPDPIARIPEERILGHFVIQYAYHALYVIRNNIRAEVFGVVTYNLWRRSFGYNWDREFRVDQYV